MAWYVWHTARWQDFANTLIAPNRRQLLDQRWVARMNMQRCDVGTGMSREECTAFNESIDVAGVREYWEAVGNAVREVARSVPASDLSEPVNSTALDRMLDDGTIANERARWLPSFLKGKNKGVVFIDGDLAHGGASAWRCSLREAGVRNSAGTVKTCRKDQGVLGERIWMVRSQVSTSWGQAVIGCAVRRRP